jgi:hypothetical protein
VKNKKRHMAKDRFFFRMWYYFRNGWSTYFAFILAAINTLTVTYYLAIEKIPMLQTIFPSFIQYIVIVTTIGIPLLVIIGYAHFKKTKARRAEVDVNFETDPYRKRFIVNTELTLELNFRMIEILLKISSGEKISEGEKQEIKGYKEKITEHVKSRTFSNQKDYEFIKKIDENKI